MLTSSAIFIRGAHLLISAVYRVQIVHAHLLSAVNHSAPDALPVVEVDVFSVPESLAVSNERVALFLDLLQNLVTELLLLVLGRISIHLVVFGVHQLQQVVISWLVSRVDGLHRSRSAG